MEIARGVFEEAFRKLLTLLSARRKSAP